VLGLQAVPPHLALYPFNRVFCREEVLDFNVVYPVCLICHNIKFHYTYGKGGKVFSS
jgi:hypothetical protein